MRFLQPLEPAEPDELLALGADLVAIDGVVAEEAMCDAPASGHVSSIP